nr:hypothetical protein [Candidatus Dormibacteraeota bacterium]
MNSTPLRQRALRIAAITMGVVGLGLLVLMVATDLLVARNLTAGIDDRLRDQMNRPVASAPVSPLEVATDDEFAEPVLRWTVAPGGTVPTAEPGTPPLPSGLATLTGY